MIQIDTVALLSTTSPSKRTLFIGSNLLNDVDAMPQFTDQDKAIIENDYLENSWNTYAILYLESSRIKSVQRETF